MTKEESGDVWISWLLEAIHKIRSQKQRPNVERVAQCVRQHHPQYTHETVHQHLEAAVREGSIVRHESKGQISYKDPNSRSKNHNKTLKLSVESDLCKVFVKCLREVNHPEGTTIREIENFVISNYQISYQQDCSL